MIRTVNFVCISMTGLVCLGLYHFAEEARIASAELRSAHAAIERERHTLTVLGAEWARLTQPARIHALAARHLDLVDKPLVELSSLNLLPSKNAPLVPEGTIRSAKTPLPQQKSREIRTAALPPGA